MSIKQTFSTKYPSIPSPNFDDRKNEVPYVSMVIIHYTAASFSSTKSTFADPKSQVSSNYVLDTDGQIYICVPENKRAWHAGVSFFGGIGYNLETKKRIYGDINSASIGIEIVNPGYIEPIVPYTEKQIFSLRYLVSDIITRYNISRKCILGHSDIAPSRKIDPGIHFPWERLTDPITNAPLSNILDSDLISKQDPSLLPTDVEIAKAFNTYGYSIHNLNNTKSGFQERYNPNAWVKKQPFSDDDKKRLLALLTLNNNIAPY